MPVGPRGGSNLLHRLRARHKVAGVLQRFPVSRIHDQAVGEAERMSDDTRPIEHRREILGNPNVDMLCFDLAVRT